MDTEYECPDCGTLHYAPTPITTCDCRASKIRAIMAENPEGNDRVTASIILDAREIGHAPTCSCHDCFTSRDGQAR